MEPWLVITLVVVGAAFVAFVLYLAFALFVYSKGKKFIEKQLDVDEYPKLRPVPRSPHPYDYQNGR